MHHDHAPRTLMLIPDDRRDVPVFAGTSEHHANLPGALDHLVRVPMRVELETVPVLGWSPIHSTDGGVNLRLAGPSLSPFLPWRRPECLARYRPCQGLLSRTRRSR